MLSLQRASLTTVAVPFTVAALLVLTVCGALYLREADQVADSTLDRENRRAEILAREFRNDISSVLSDLRLLATGDGLVSYLSTGASADLDRAVKRAVFFSKDNPDYDQVRYINSNGQELIRINRGGEIVPKDQLQNKGERPYFLKTNQLGKDEIYISAIDLNVENGAVQLPPKPTIRLAIPVFDANGQRHGIYIINYLVGNTIERLRQFVPRYAQRFRLLNAQGYWLAGATPEQEWGFMLPDRSSFSLAKTDPAVWADISARQEGQVPFHGGYLTWERAIPSNFAAGKPIKLVTEDPYLIFASDLSSSDWAAGLASLRQTFVLVGLILLCLTLVITWFFQTRLRAQQERDRIFSLTRDMLCVAGFDGYFKRVNPAWEKALGYSQEELLQLPFIDFVHPDDRDKTKEISGFLTKGQEVTSFENRYRCKDGSYRWLLWSARPLVEEKLIYASARDLTERKEIEEKLRHNEQRSRSIIESAYDAFVSIDTSGRIKDWNLMAERVFGWTRAEAIGRLLHETIIPPVYRESHVTGMKHLEATGEGPVLNKTLEMTALRRDGVEFPVEFVIWPLRMGSDTTFHAFIRDITKRKDSEERIHKLNGELQQRAELQEAANKELEAFSYSVSHDLRAPLRHIHGFVELLQKSPTVEHDEEAVRFMNVISRAAREMGRLIDDLLAFSRTGRAEMRTTQVDMREMIDHVIADRVMEINGRHVNWDIKPMVKVAADPALLRLVWINLIDNALKYSRPRDETRIEIGQLKPEAEAPSREGVFFIRDNGVGFDMQYASKLFGVFQRLHRSEDFEGTGIGLANVQRIVHRHGGRLWAESQIDAGATFFFTLPVTESKITSTNGNG